MALTATAAPRASLESARGTSSPAGANVTAASSVVLRDIEEWSYEEIAASLALPVGTVKSRIARGRGQLREILLPLLSGRLP